jgi:hypothetical protein
MAGEADIFRSSQAGFGIASKIAENHLLGLLKYQQAFPGV